jgi:hypothetical protein
MNFLRELKIKNNLKTKKMELLQLKQHIESFPDGTIFKNSLSEPFSWRGVYAEVAFDVLVGQEMSKQDMLANIEKAYTETFYGHKGGEYTYDDYTDVHFEEGRSRWSDGRHCVDLIAKLTGEEPIQDEETRLVKLAFNN